MIMFKAKFCSLICLLLAHASFLSREVAGADLKEDWGEAVRIATDLISERRLDISDAELIATLDRIEQLAGPIVGVRRSQRPPMETKREYVGMVQELLDIRNLFPARRENCLSKLPNRNFHDINRRLDTNWTYYNEALKRFVRQAYRLQLSICIEYLRVHFDMRINEISRTGFDGNKFASLMANYWDQRPDFTDLGASAKFLANIVFNYYEPSLIREYMTKESGLENLISHRFVRKCTINLVLPLRALMVTLDRVEDPQLRESIKATHEKWINAYHLCNQFARQVDRHWAQLIYEHLPDHLRPANRPIPERPPVFWGHENWRHNRNDSAAPSDPNKRPRIFPFVTESDTIDNRQIYRPPPVQALSLFPEEPEATRNVNPTSLGPISERELVSALDKTIWPLDSRGQRAEADQAGSSARVAVEQHPGDSSSLLNLSLSLSSDTNMPEVVESNEAETDPRTKDLLYIIKGKQKEQ